MAMGTHKLRIIGLALIIVCGAAGAVWGTRYWSERRSEKAALAKLAEGDANSVRGALLALSKDDLSGPNAADVRRKAVENMRRRPFEEMARLRDSDDLTEEQRKQLRENMGELMRGYMEDRTNEYFNAPKEDKEKVLDQHIDDWMSFRKEMEAYREKHKDDPERKAEGERRRDQGPRRDTQEAKKRMEGGNPDQQAKMMFYFSQMRARAEARGIDMGMGGRGFGGWWGGGRGGAGGGPPGGGPSSSGRRGGPG